MPFISIDIYAQFEPTLPGLAARILHSNAVQHLHFNAGLTTIRIAFALDDEQWFQNLRLLDRVKEPTFHANATMGNKTATILEVVAFVTESRDSLEQLFAQIYPGTTYPQIPNRNKVTVIEMP